MEVIVFREMKSKYMAIVELGSDVYDAIMKVGKLKVGLSVCPIYEHAYMCRSSAVDIVNLNLQLDSNLIMFDTKCPVYIRSSGIL